MAREYFVTTLIVPAVGGIVKEVEIEANQVVEKGTVLFRIDPKPYEAIVRQKQALLTGTREGVKELEQAVAAARARVVKAFRQMRQHLMALFSVEAGAVQRLGPEDTREILDQVRAAIVAIRQAGSPTHSLPREQP